ncbi:hypothetical protein GCM10010317_032330 [Streptomyces mirabilis]|uniref:hypothetical protein n=1 Tax=Streptomyces mirabilis TaxID=68239 RepID=UPI00167EB87C|nr:hypothetical protein [Streptomyces mirabilis]GHD51554.1 hypothetical protein GCM10010317_032330 [Streptomyces mirabilis]
MKRSALSRPGVAVVASALSLALATGCSDSGSDSGSGSGSGSGDKSTGGKGATATVKALSDAELKKLLVGKDDLGGYRFAAADQSERFASSKEEITVVDDKCAPLAYVLTGFAPGDSTAYVNTMATPVEAKPSASSTKSMEDMTDKELDDALNSITDTLGGTVTIISLSSYEGDGAQKAMSSVSDAVKGCTGGFTATAKGAKDDAQKFTKVEAEKASGSGDESVAFAVTGDADGDKIVVHGEAVRHGSTVATYYSMNLAVFLADGKPKEYGIPAELIKAQAGKLA